jgi:hypothetical protein
VDPNETLKQTIRLADRVLLNETPEGEPIEDYEEIAYELAEKIEALDEWLTKGGFLPRRWKR